MPAHFTVYFVKNDTEESSNSMNEAFKLIGEKLIKKEWIAHSKITEISLKRNDVVVFDDFENDTFNKLSTAQVMYESLFDKILQPVRNGESYWDTFLCYAIDRRIPNKPSKIYSLTMENIRITTSGFSGEEKERIQKKVEYMLGTFSNLLTNTTTHLIVNSVQTVKYAKASEQNLKVMLSSWIDDLWDTANKDQSYTATDEESIIFRKNICPVFYKLQISLTGFNSRDKEQMKSLVLNNGGEFLEQCIPKRTSVLVCDKLDKPNTKVIKMTEYNIPCVTREWVYDSIKKGFAVIETSYIVTPESIIKNSKMEKSKKPSLNGEMTSSSATTVALYKSMEDQLDLIFRGGKETNKKISNVIAPAPFINIGKVINEIDMNIVKKAGLFLDGCSVFLYGFENEYKAKLAPILNFGGAVRYDEMKSSVTHVLVGVPNFDELKKFRKTFQNVLIVTLKWLLKCIESKFPMSEEDFLIDLNVSIEPKTPSTPLSKKSLTLLQDTAEESQSQDLSASLHGPIDTFVSTNPDLTDTAPDSQDLDDDRLLLQQYLDDEKFNEVTFSEVMRISNLDDMSESSLVSETSKVFSGLKILLYEFPKKSIEAVTLGSIMVDFGAELVTKNFVGVVDYAIVPTFNETDIILKSCVAAQVLNDLWIKDCIEFGKLVEPPQYYHHPITIAQDAKPFINQVFTITQCRLYHLNFVEALIEKLGGKVQNVMSRSQTPQYLRTTYLICTEEKGDKYSLALIWKLPIVNPEWLVKCAQERKLTDVRPYLFNKNAKLPAVRGARANKSNRSLAATKFNRRVRILDSRPQMPLILKDRLIIEGTSSNTSSGSIKRHLDFDDDNPLHQVKKLNRRNVAETVPFNDFPTPKDASDAFTAGAATSRDSQMSTNEFQPEQALVQKATPSPPPPSQTMDKVREQLHELNDLLGKSHQRRVQQPKVVKPTESCSAEETVNYFRHSDNLPESQTASVVWDNDAYVEMEQNLSSTTKEAKKFMFTTVDMAEKERLTKMIIEIGGTVSDFLFFDNSATHLVVGDQLNRNEKLLGSVVSGIWVVYKAYIEISWQQKKFVNESLFEVGNPMSAGQIPFETNSLVRSVYGHGQRIRVRKEAKIFEGFNCVIFSQKADIIERLIRAGGGIVHANINLPVPDNLLLTHCFLDLKMIENFKITDFIHLAKRKVFVLSTEVLNLLIVKFDSVVRFQDYVLPNLKQYY